MITMEKSCPRSRIDTPRMDIYDLIDMPDPIWELYYKQQLATYAEALGPYGEIRTLREGLPAVDHCAGLAINLRGDIFPIFLGEEFPMRPCRLVKDEHGTKYISQGSVTFNTNMFESMSVDDVVGKLEDHNLGTHNINPCNTIVAVIIYPKE